MSDVGSDQRAPDEGAQGFGVSAPGGAGGGDALGVRAMNDYFKPSTPDELERTADVLGCDVKYPLSNQLFLDFDSDDAYGEFVDRCGLLLSSQKDVGGVEVSVTESKTKGHCHVVVTLSRDLDPWERIALQAALGSDSKRELLACLKQRDGKPGPTCFFEPKPGHVQVPEKVVSPEERTMLRLRAVSRMMTRGER